MKPMTNYKHKLLSFLQFSAIFVLLIGMQSCFDDEESWQEQGLAPIYVSDTDFSLINSEEPRPSVDQGSILEIDDYIYINERFKGIHVFNNTDPGNPLKEYFWAIPGNSEFNISDDFLYADNSRHLITIDISDKSNIKYLSHIPDLYTVNMENDNYPKDYIGRFECADFEKGIVTGWESRLLDSPRCYILF